MKISSVLVALVVIATVSTIGFVGISENTQAFSSEGSETIEINLQETVSFSDSVIITANTTNNLSG
jgi:hypothetical protein